METQIFHHAKIQSSKNPLKKNQNPSKYYDPITNLKFQHKPKYHLQKSLYQNKPIITLGPKSLKLLYSIMNVNTISLPSW